MKTNIQVTSKVKGLFYYLWICYLEDNCWVCHWQKTNITTGQPHYLVEQERRRALAELYLGNLHEAQYETRNTNSTPSCAEVCEPCRQGIHLAIWQLCARCNAAWEFDGSTCCMTCSKVPNSRTCHLPLRMHSEQMGSARGGFCARASPGSCLKLKHAAGERYPNAQLHSCFINDDCIYFRSFEQGIHQIILCV